VSARRRQIELSVERPIAPRGGEGAVARLCATFDVGSDGEGPTAEELARALDELVRDLVGLVGTSPAAAPAGRTDRDLTELVETYRPRQRELVDLLLADGEISPGEHALLVGTLGARAPAPSAPSLPELAAVGETPIAAVPIVAEPKLPPARPIPELLRTFQITSLRQAGAVRARRQISFAEYMALKRHFEAEGAPGNAKGSGSSTGPA
jgi:hypothetical protein